MDFEKMKDGCPWINDPDEELTTCLATGMDCVEHLCTPFHWIEELASDLYISVDAELRSNLE